MRITQFLLSTLKEVPADGEIISHQLMLRAGMIRKLASGLYTWLPLGLRVLKKVEAIIREEMNASGALEILMPAVQPAELWQETGRWEKFGPQLLKLADRHERPFCFGPTHEEVITDLMRRELKSYKQLPINLYQLQWKFRDEIRPRFGVMRAREFLMKDAYSFHLNRASLEVTYDVMYATYTRIFTRLGLDFRAVLADTGSIGGSRSHEFHVLAQSGEDEILFSNGSDYAANVELARAATPNQMAPAPTEVLSKVATPACTTIPEISAALHIPASRIVKTLFVQGRQDPVVAVLLRGDHEINPLKAEKHPLIASPFTLATAEQITIALQSVGMAEGSPACPMGYLGPLHLAIPQVADEAVLELSDFVCGANEIGMHYMGVNWERDLPRPPTADLRKAVAGDISPDGKGRLQVARGIEVGHIFQLGTVYSEAMQARVLDETGQNVTLHMGCYGIGVSRITAAAIEQNHDERGIIWPDTMAPFQIAIIPINMDKSSHLQQTCQMLYTELLASGFEVLWDDRKERPGVLFADMELIGIPHHLILSERGLAADTIEYKNRRTGRVQQITRTDIVKVLQEVISR